MRRRSSRHIDMLPLLDVFMVVLFVFATIQEDEHEAERAEFERLVAQLDVSARQQQAEAATRLEVVERGAADAKAESERLAAQLDASAQQQAEVTARLEAAEREAADAKEAADKLRAEAASVVKQFILSNKDTPGIDDTRGVDEFLRREEVLDKLLDHFTVFEIEVVGEANADGSAVTNRCCYRTDTSKTPWKSCETVPYREAELDAWLQDGGDGLVAALRRTKGGNAMTVIRQDTTATSRVTHTLRESLLKFFPEHEIYSMVPEESPTLVSRLCGGI